MLSPAKGLPDAVAALSPYLRLVRRWLGQAADRDAAKYESFSLNAEAEFYLLVRDLRLRRMQPLQVPVFMVGSGDDATVDSRPALDFFCDLAPVNEREMIWYYSTLTASEPARDCDGLQLVAAAYPALRQF